MCEFVRDCESASDLRLTGRTEYPKSTVFMAQLAHNGDVVVIYDFRYVQSGAKCIKISRRTGYPRKHLAHDCRNGVIDAVDPGHFPQATCCCALPLHGDSENSALGYS